MLKNYALTIAISSVLAFFLLYFLFAYSGIMLSVEEGYKIGESSRWCERISSGYFREPSNALSNIGFILCGIFMVWILSREEVTGQNFFIGLTSISTLYASASIFLGPGSLMMHGTHTVWGAWIDNVSMVAYIIIPWLLNFKILNGWSENQFLKAYFIILFLFSFFSWFYGSELGIGFSLFGVSIGLWVISEFLYNFYSSSMRFFSGFVGYLVLWIFGTSPYDVALNIQEFWWTLFFWLPGLIATQKPESKRKYNPWFFAGCFFYILAFTIWLQGNMMINPDSEWCYPDSIIQPHALWHIICALATLSFFFFYRTEKRLQTSQNI